MRTRVQRKGSPLWGEGQVTWDTLVSDWFIDQLPIHHGGTEARRLQRRDDKGLVELQLRNGEGLGELKRRHREGSVKTNRCGSSPKYFGFPPFSAPPCLRGEAVRRLLFTDTDTAERSTGGRPFGPPPVLVQRVSRA